MLNELDALENKIAQVASFCRALQTENKLLRQRIAAVEAEKQGLAERMDSVRQRIEQLVQQLPEEKNIA